MGTQSQLIRRRLAEINPEFRKLLEEHARYEEELERLTEMTPRSLDQELEMARFKKLKLQAKDRMEEIIRIHRQQEAEAVEAT
jgi:uncharacterized protein YdcH (DUF465 family)